MNGLTRQSRGLANGFDEFGVALVLIRDEFDVAAVFEAKDEVEPFSEVVELHVGDGGAQALRDQGHSQQTEPLHVFEAHHVGENRPLGGEPVGSNFDFRSADAPENPQRQRERHTQHTQQHTHDDEGHSGSAMHPKLVQGILLASRRRIDA